METAAQPYEFFDHTADIGIVARGQTLAEAFANAGVALFALMTDLSKVDEKVAVSIEVTADDLEGLLVAWLNELLWYADAEGLLFKRFEVHELTPTRLRATAYGEPKDPSRHTFHLYVKAATYHQASVSVDGGAQVRVIVDV